MEQHKEVGEHILGAVDERIRTELFAHEDFKVLVLNAASAGRSVAEVLAQLREPQPNGTISLPWLGEVASREHVIRLCARGLIAINLGRDWLQTKPGEEEADAWNRMKRRLPAGKALEGVTIHPPGAAVVSGGTQPASEPPAANAAGAGSGATGQPANGIDTTATAGGGTDSTTNPFDDNKVKERVPRSAAPTAPINLLGKLETWGIGAGSQVHNLKRSVPQLTGAQLEQLLKKLPDGITYGLDLEQE